MVFEDDLFIITYEKESEDVLNRLTDTLKSKMPRILDFFKVSFDSKIEIILWSNLEGYKKNLIDSFEKEGEGREFHSWMIANTEDGNLNMQSLSLVRKLEDFKDISVDEFCDNAVHELVHLVHEEAGSTNPGWFWEVIATNLGNPDYQHEIKEKFTLEDLEERFDEIDGYGAAFKIGKYLFKHYFEHEILEMIKDNDKLMEVILEVIEEVNK